MRPPLILMTADPAKDAEIIAEIQRQTRRPLAIVREGGVYQIAGREVMDTEPEAPPSPWRRFLNVFR